MKVQKEKGTLLEKLEKFSKEVSEAVNLKE